MMNSRLLQIIILILLTCSVFPQGFLRRSGKTIINDNGEIILKGMGLGGWLVPEGYMLQTSSFANSATQIRKKIEDLIGTDNTEEFYKLYYQNYIREIDIKALAEWGFNSVRLPLHYALLTPKDQPDVYIEEGFKTIDSVLSWCEKYKLYLILDLHAAPGAQNKDNISDSDGEARLWTEPANQTRTVNLWKKLAERYADKKWIGGYDLINETAYDLGSGNVPLRNLFINITNAIREVDKNHILFIEGNWYATDFNGLTPPWDDNMAYSFHKYWNGVNINSIQYLLSIRNAYNIPLWLGESGENSNAWFTDCITLMNEQKIGWAWWTHKKIASISGLLDVPMFKEYETLLNYWKGSGAKPAVDYAKNALIKLAQNLAFEKCIVNKDVIDALIRQPYDNTTIPFAENKIPGIVFGPDYDMGKRGIAYQDKDYAITGGMGSSTYNTGWIYRNDGVDIEACDDWSSNGYNIGWIETGDWLLYTVNVESSATYDIKVRISGTGTSGKILLRLDNNNLGDFISVPATGGWQNWQDASLSDIYIPAGTHSLQVNFYFGGFNFSHIEFVKKTTGVDESNQAINEFKLEQNYPNPFNPTTKISYSIPEEGFVSLTIYDLIGNKITQAVNEVKKAGKHEISFDAGSYNLSNGIYFYRLEHAGRMDTKKFILLK